MKIGGFIPSSFSDFPGHPAAVIFTQGCNWDCPFCHNTHLLDAEDTGSMDTPESIVQWLKGRANVLEHVVISGGEPTIHKDLETFIRRIRALGYSVKLDTNGSNPKMLRHLIEEQLIDYVAMDIKAPAAKYNLLTGTAVNLVDVQESIDFLAESKIPHHFRTTKDPQFLTDADIQQIQRSLPFESKFVEQEFKVLEERF